MTATLVCVPKYFCFSLLPVPPFLSFLTPADNSELQNVLWRLVIIDEAHRLKNKNCKMLEGLKELQMVSMQVNKVLTLSSSIRNKMLANFSCKIIVFPPNFGPLISKVNNYFYYTNVFTL